MDVKTDSSCSIPSIDSCHKCVDQMIERFDEDLGGFGGAPKFPQPGTVKLHHNAIVGVPKIQRKNIGNFVKLGLKT